MINILDANLTISCSIGRIESQLNKKQQILFKKDVNHSSSCFSSSSTTIYYYRLTFKHPATSEPEECWIFKNTILLWLYVLHFRTENYYLCSPIKKEN